MRLHKDEEGAPCKGMEDLLQQVADGSAGGLKKAYALAHAAQCSRCGNFITRMKVTLDVMRESKEDVSKDEAMARLRAKVQELEAATGE